MNKHEHARSAKAAAIAILATCAFGFPSDLVQGGGIPRSEQSEAVAQPTKTEGAPPFDLSDPKKIQSGETTFNSTCAAYCHGQNPTLFVERTGLTEEYVYNTIRDGGKGATPMPPWGDVFSHEEIWELVAYLKSLGKW